MATEDREKALEAALAQIDKQYGKGSVMRLGEEVRRANRGHSNRLHRPRCGSRHRRLAARQGRGNLRPESSGKTTVALHAIANAQAEGGICAFIDAEHALDPEYAGRLGVDTDSLWSANPTTASRRWRSPTC